MLISTTGYTGYITNKTITGTMAQQFSGSSIVLEHRFFGLSNPYNDLSDNSLRLLTIQQSIDDLVYFAQNVNLPMPGGDRVTPDKTPWILVGGSYGGEYPWNMCVEYELSDEMSGALTGWTMVK